jgi:hypothetical protein
MPSRASGNEDGSSLAQSGDGYTLPLARAPACVSWKRWATSAMPLGGAELGLLEASLGRRLHPTFRELLPEANGLSVFLDAVSIFDLRTSYARGPARSVEPYSLATPNREEGPSDAPSDALIVGCCRWDGSSLYMRTDGRVHRSSRDSARSLNEWSSLETCLFSAVSRLSKMAEAKGRIHPRAPTIP